MKILIAIILTVVLTSCSNINKEASEFKDIIEVKTEEIIKNGKEIIESIDKDKIKNAIDLGKKD